MGVLLPMLSESKFEKAKSIIRTLRKAGFEAVIVGGAVRDHCMGKCPEDFDIATDAIPDEVERLFQRTIPVGKQFGVMLVLLGKDQFEVSTFRKDLGYSDGRRPDAVSFASIREDVLRRDFTINGLFWDPESGEIRDFVGGQEDIRKKLIRCIGNPESRFEEDKLRVLRAIRFASSLNFDIETETWKAVCDPRFSLSSVSRERIRMEFVKILTRGHVMNALELLRQSQLSQYMLCPELFLDPILFPEFLAQLFVADEFLSLESALAFMAIGSEKLFIYDEKASLFTLCPDFAKILDSFCKFLKALTFSRAAIEGQGDILRMIAQSFLVKNKDLPFLRKYLGHSFGKESLAVLRRMEQMKKVADPLYPVLEKTLRDFEGKELLPKPLLTGQHLIHQGWNPGPHFQEALAKAYDWQLSDDTLTQAMLLKRLVGEKWSGVESGVESGDLGKLL